MRPKLLICSVISLLVFSCSEDVVSSIPGHEISGETQGTTYTIILAEDAIRFTKKEIDALLDEFDQVLSTYVDNSKISQLNKSNDAYAFRDERGFFAECYNKSRQVYDESNGAFDPSVFPLIEGWGFLKHIESPLSQHEIDSILTFISFRENLHHRIEFSNDSVLFFKKDTRFKLDFNAIAQGQSIDVLYEFIASKGHKNFYIEIGGEIRVKGKNREGEAWRIGIDTPKENQPANERPISGILNITNKAVATSGNYRNFYEKDGKKYAHILDPKTGKPADHNLLSATVIAEDCAIADAYATVFMVLGLEASKKLLQSKKRELDVVFIYQEPNGKLEIYTTKNAKKMLE